MFEGGKLYFESDVIVDYSFDGTSQGKIYFGVERTTQVTAVVKEYKYTNYRDLLRELYILSKIESRRQANLIDKPPQ